jgi:hypothetical protein
MDGSNLLKKIDESFGWRPRISRLGPVDAPDDEISADVALFLDLNWEAVTLEKLNSSPDVIFGLSPNAFKYFLPGFIRALVLSGGVDSIVCHSLIGMLNRGSDSAIWEDFFLRRWAGLTKSEYSALQDWLLWVSGMNDGAFESIELDRAFETLSLLSSDFSMD